MGARNAMLAYHLYAGTVPPQSMTLLAYMALVSKDDDERPWYGQGHAALAENALGRREPTKGDLRAVERGVSPLLSASAVAVGRPAAPRRYGPSTVRYDLNLTIPSHETPDGNRRENARRFVTQRPTESDPTPDGNRRTEETGGDRRSEVEEKEHDGAEAFPRARERVTADINEDKNYERASARLQREPDLGAYWRKLAEQRLGDGAGMRALVIEAARILDDTEGPDT